MRIDFTKGEILKVLLLFLLLVAILAGMLWPTVLNINNTSSETMRLRDYMEQKYEQSLMSRITKRKIADIKDEYPNLSRHIFKKGDELMLITYMENMAAKHDLTQTIVNSNIDQITNNKVVLSLSMTGEYHNILTYMTDLESSDYFLNIEQLQITPIFSRSGEATDEATLYLTLGLYVNR